MLEDAGVPTPSEAVDDIWREIERRQTLATRGYPFGITASGVQRSMAWDKSLPYAFQLLVALSGCYSGSRIAGAAWNRTAKLFEQLATEAVSQYLNGSSLNVGAPRQRGVPKDFTDCLNHLSVQLNEQRGGVPAYSSHTKDENVDVIGWIPFGDKRASQVIVLLQCAAGEHWKSKVTDISIEVWSQLINWTVRPLVAFAFPFVCESDEWDYLSRSGGILFDRLRIALPTARSTLSPALSRSLKNWCTSHARSFPSASYDF